MKCAYCGDAADARDDGFCSERCAARLSDELERRDVDGLNAHMSIWRWTMEYDWTTETNARGATVKRAFADGDRYIFDRLCSAAKGWKHYDTEQDAWYFGVWINAESRMTLTYAEGDIVLVECPDEAVFQAELAHMADFYGPPPPVATAILANGTITKIYDEAGFFGRKLDV